MLLLVAIEEHLGAIDSCPAYILEYLFADDPSPVRSDKLKEVIAFFYGSAGFDLRSPRDAVIPARGKFLILTDLRIQVPDGYYGRIAARSSLAFFHHITIEAGVIDEDYRGNIGVLLFNQSNYPYLIRRGVKIAQLICEKICYPKLEMVTVLDDTFRGTGGFGSTGKN
jgi:dUTP pyrophosphatase